MSYRKWLTVIASTLLAVLVLAVGGMVWATRIVTDPGFPALLPDATIQVQEKAFRMRDQRCDVLIYGDSSASTGVDPRVITAETGMSACNIATTGPVVSALGMLPVEDFLAHNPKPKILVLQFDPEMFFRGKPWDPVIGIAPYMLLLRQRPGWHTAWTMAMHPTLTANFYQNILETRYRPKRAELAHFWTVYRKPLDDWKTSGGLLTLTLKPLTRCEEPPVKLYGPIDRKWPRELREEFEKRGIQVIIKASPQAACDPQLELFQKSTAGLVDSTVEAMPVDDFLPGGRHMTLAGAQAETHALVKTILALEKKAPEKTVAGQPQ